MSDYGKETVVVVEIDQPQCTREYGDAFVSPTGGCAAVLGSSGTRKCYNTRVTCQDEVNYNPGTLTLRFGRNQEGLLRHYDNVVGAITGMETTPGKINLGGTDQNLSPFGQREVVAVTISDFLHSDLLVDKYRLQRKTGVASSSSPAETFDPYTRGTFWGKFLARNPYHANYPLRVREGFMGDALEDMRVRHYLIDRIDGPIAGQVKVTAKDIFSKVEAQKAVAPTASRGRLQDDWPPVGSPDGQFTVLPAGIGAEDYAAAGFVKIGNEIVQYTRAGDVFTVVARAAKNSTSEQHKSEDAVQQVLCYTTALAVDIVHDLLCSYTPLGAAGSPTGSPYIDKSAWNTAAASLTELYTATIATPTPVRDLVGELMLQGGFTIWPNVETGLIEFKTLRAGTSSAVMDDDGFLVDGTLGLAKLSAQRISQVWVYYAQIDPTKDLANRQNYRSRLVDDDVDAEDDTQYGAPAIKEIFSRWIPQFGRAQALNCAERILAMFRDPPTEATFNLHASRIDLVDLAGYITLKTAEVQDETGSQDEVQHAITAIERGENELRIDSQSVVFFDPSTSSAGGAREIHIENDDYNLNLRTIHDSIYSAPVAASPTDLTVRFIVDAGVIVGSLSTVLPALKRGTWPAGVDIQLVVHGRVQGKGGQGGQGYDGVTAHAGEDGGDALDCSEGVITVDNTDGEIWAGGAGGGGTGIITSFPGPTNFGAGGGGAAGTDPGNGGADGGVMSGMVASSAGTSEAGGAGGHNSYLLYGGAGGDPGQNGAAGASGDIAGAAGGTKGDYIVGNANVTWTALGDVRGGTS
jgi:hypothetical protein